MPIAEHQFGSSVKDKTKWYYPTTKSAYASIKKDIKEIHSHKVTIKPPIKESKKTSTY